VFSRSLRNVSIQWDTGKREGQQGHGSMGALVPTANNEKVDES